MSTLPKTSSPAACALITGAGRRIGAQVAKALHKQGFDVAIHYNRSEQSAKELTQQLNDIRTQSAACFKADLAQKVGCDALLSAYGQWRPSLQLLVNNASTFDKTPFGEVSEAQWHHQMEGNAKATFFVTQAALPLLKTTLGANVINLSDARWDRPLPGFSAYAGAKAAIVAFTRGLAVELAPGIRVNAIGPGSLDWPDGNMFSAEEVTQLENKIPLRRIGSGQDIAQAVLYLCDPTSYLTGQIINVDGGTSVVSA